MTDAKVKLGLDWTDLHSGLGQVNDSFEALGKSAGVVLAPLVAGVTRAVEVLGGLALKADEAARAERRLFSAMQSRTGVTREAFAALKDYNTATERKLGIDADDLAALQGTLSLRGVANEQLQDATKFVIGLGEANIAEGRAIKIVNDVLEGNIKTFQRYFPEVTSAAEAHAKLNELYKVAEANSDDLTTQVGVLGIAYDNLEEAVGAVILKTGVFQAAAKNLAADFNAFADDLNDSDGFVDALGAVWTAMNRMPWDRHIDQINAARKSVDDYVASASKLGDDTIRVDAVVIKLGDIKRAAKEAADEAKRLADESAKILGQNQLAPSASSRGINLGLLNEGDITGSPFQGSVNAGAFGEGADELFDADARNKALEDYQAYNARWQAIADDFAAEMDADDARVLEAKGAFYGDLAATTAAGLGGMLAELSSGQSKVGPAMGKLLGTLATTLIPPLVSMAAAGTASGGLAATIGTPAAIITGPLLAAAVAAFGIAVGNVASGLGSRGDTGLAAAKAGKLPNFAATPASVAKLGNVRAPVTTAIARRDRATQPIVYNVHFGTGPAIVGGSPQRVARDVTEFLRRYSPTRT